MGYSRMHFDKTFFSKYKSEIIEQIQNLRPEIISRAHSMLTFGDTQCLQSEQGIINWGNPVLWLLNLCIFSNPTMF